MNAETGENMMRLARLIAVLAVFLTFFTTESFANSSLTFYIIQDQLVLDNSSVKSATINEEKNGVYHGLNIELKPSATKYLNRISAAAIGKSIALILNTKIINMATIQSELGSSFIITGITKEDAQQFINSLKKNS